MNNRNSHTAFIISTLCALFVTHRVQTCECPTVTYIPIHSQSFNTLRARAGTIAHTCLPNRQQLYVAFSCTPGCTKSFRPERIVQSLFGTNVLKCERTLTISGSKVAERESSDWLADYFGLPTDFKSRVQFTPRVKNKFIDTEFYLGLDGILPGCFASIQLPIVKTIWDLKYKEHTSIAGTNNYDAGYFTPTTIARTDLLNNFTEFISGQKQPQSTEVAFHPLSHARMSPCQRAFTSFSDMQLMLGCFFYQSSDAHLELHARGAIPLGNRPQGDFLFEPIIGNGHHKEIGGGISMHWTHHEPTDGSALRFDLQCDAVHLPETLQRRSFDLKNKPNSRYMLAQKMGALVEDGLSGDTETEPITAQFKKLYTPVANLTTGDCMVQVPAQIDFNIIFSYFTQEDSWSFGYGFWSRSADKIRLCQTHIELNRWALKGDSRLYGFNQLKSNTPIPLSATQSEATINTGTNKMTTDNQNIDNPKTGYINETTPLSIAPAPAPPEQIKTSIQPRFFSATDIDSNSARSYGFAHRIMTHWAHTWQTESVAGTIGFGGEIEFGMRHYTARKKPELILNSALSYWGVWLKTSLTFR